jgi:hypothetical protein
LDCAHSRGGTSLPRMSLPSCTACSAVTTNRRERHAALCNSIQALALRVHRVEAAGLDIPIGPVGSVAQDQESRGASGEARGRRGLGRQAMDTPTAYLKCPHYISWLPRETGTHRTRPLKRAIAPRPRRGFSKMMLHAGNLFRGHQVAAWYSGSANTSGI